MRATITMLLFLNLAATAAIAWHTFKPRRFVHRVDFYRDDNPAGLLRSAGQEGWQLVSLRRANNGRGYDAEWGTEVVLQREE